MIERIREKLESHVNDLINKPALSQEEFCLLRFYLERLEHEANQKRLDAEREVRDKQLRDMMSILGGGSSGV